MNHEPDRMTGTLKLFAPGASRPLGERVAAILDIPLAALEERSFEDGEHKARPLESVRGEDVYVLHSLHADAEQSVNDKLVRLLFLIGTLRDAGAERVTALVPYLCYARKERKTKSRDPVATRYVASMFESVGVDRVVTLDVHNLAAFQNAFRCRTEHLEATRLFVDHFAPLIGAREAAVVSPDVGGVKRAEAFRAALERRLARPLAGAFMDKQRSAGVVSGEGLVGDVASKVVILLDDIIASGTTMARCAAACCVAGAIEVHAVASHGVFVGADAQLAGAALDSIVVTSSIPPFRITDPTLRERLVVLEAAGLFAEAVRRLHEDGSLVELMEC